MLTYNIWYSTEKMRERMKALGQIVEDLEPDILAFQEVTVENLAVLQEQRWFSRYSLIPPDVVKRLQGGPSKFYVVILSAFPVDKWQVYPFKNSPRNLRLVIAETKSSLSSKNVRFVIAVTHLAPAGKDTRLREAQLKESFQIISGYDNVCVMGDLNIEDKTDGDIVLPSPWIDAWLSIPGNTDSNGYTWDRSKTPFASVLRRTVNATSYQARLDRVLCKMSDFKVKDMRIVGDKVTKSGILPSDHFGLFTAIELTEESEHEGNENKKLQTESEVYFNRPPG
ncbi:5'-tyrosyl-DNA phosphodiesterase-like [Oculina patagonica]